MALMGVTRIDQLTANYVCKARPTISPRDERVRAYPWWAVALTRSKYGAESRCRLYLAILLPGARSVILDLRDEHGTSASRCEFIGAAL